jgi:hypothetical protein
METKFKIVEEEEYIFAVSDEEIKKGDCHRFTCFDGDIIKKIIAYKPKGNALELDLPLLPDVEDDVEKLVKKYISDTLKDEESDDYLLGRVKGFKDGHKSATKVYSEEDLRRAIEESISWWEAKPDEKYGQINTSHDFGNQFIQSLKQTKWFVAEMKHTKSEVFRENDNVPYAVLKTTTINNKTYLVGTYLN